MVQKRGDHETCIEGPAVQPVNAEGKVAQSVTPTSALENALAPSKSRKHSNAPNGNSTSNVVPVYRKIELNALNEDGQKLDPRA